IVPVFGPPSNIARDLLELSGALLPGGIDKSERHLGFDARAVRLEAIRNPRIDSRSLGDQRVESLGFVDGAGGGCILRRRDTGARDDQSYETEPLVHRESKSGESIVLSVRACLSPDGVLPNFLRTA